MSAQMADVYGAMVSFQQGLHAGILELSKLPDHTNLYAHADTPAPGVRRITYVRLAEDGKTVKAFISCLMNGFVDGFPCVAVGYAVPEDMRNKGLAKQIFRDVVREQTTFARRAGFKEMYIEAVIDITNLPSQRVAEAVLGGKRDTFPDSESGLPACRYTGHYDTATGHQL